MMQTSAINSSAAYARRWGALAVLCTAQFMVIMDTSIIGVALPAIQKDLGYSNSNLQWIFNAYVILLGGLLLLGGRLSDTFGPRKIFMTGFGILTIASLMAGVSTSETMMNISRGLQGAGSALIAPAALTLLMTIFTDPKELGKAFGFWGASAAAGGSAGVFLGGLLTQWLSWEWVFLINIPMGIVVLLISKHYLPIGQSQRSKLDLLSAAIATGALVLLVYTIVTGESYGWGSATTLGMLLVSVILFIIFFKRQKAVKNPMLPLYIFKAPNLAAGNLVTLFLAGAWIPLWFFLNIYLQQVLQLSAFNSGLALLPMTVVIMIMMTSVTGKLIGKWGPKTTLIVGLLFLLLALILFANVSATGSFLVNVLPASVLAAIGMSLAYIPATIISMGVKPEESGLASGIVNTSYQIGSAIGLAIVVAISSALTSQLDATEMANSVLANHTIRYAFIVATVVAALGVITAIKKVKK